MALMQDEDARFKNLSRKIGWFVLVAIAGLGFLFASLVMKEGVFRPATHLHFVTDSGQDLRKGMAVKLSGFRIGQVSSLALTEDAHVRVELRIDSQYMKWIRSDSQARLAKEGLIGDAVISISPGTETLALLRDNEAIAFERERALSGVVEKLYDDVGPLLQDIRRIVRYLDDPQGDVKQSLHGLNTAMSELNGTLKRFDRLMASAEKDLPGTLRSTRETIEKSSKVVDSVSRTWPISSHIEPPKSATLPVDSYERPPAKPAEAK